MDQIATTLAYVLAGAGTLTVAGWLTRAYLLIKPRLDDLASYLDGVLRVLPERRESVTYGEALRYFATHPLAETRNSRGAMLLKPERDDGGFLFTQVFLNANDELVLDPRGRPYGRRLLVQTIDESLTRLFHGKDVVIVPGVSRQLPSEPEEAALRYDEVVQDVLNRVAKTPGAARGAIILERDARGCLVQEVFLDTNDGLICEPGGKPVGRQRRAGAIDEDFRKAFRDVDVLMVEPQGGRESVVQPPQSEPATMDVRVEKPRDAKAAETRDAEVETLRFRDVVDYFVEHRPADPRVRKGALLVERRRGRYVIDQLFLDGSDQPVPGPRGKPLGRRIVAGRFDAELRDIVGDKSVVLFE